VAFAAVGFPTTILGDHADRLADVRRALGRGLPSLFISGDADHFCELDLVRGWVSAHANARLDVVPGGHFFVGDPAYALSARVAAFVREVC
jgi:pimeloyl-ACP methyl ester carboxylesterase